MAIHHARLIRRAVNAGIVAAGIATPVLAHAQDPQLGSQQRGFHVLSGNLAAGGATAALTAAIGGRNIPRAFVRGAIGGGLMYLGKAAAARPQWPAIALGRSVSAVGAVVVSRAGTGAAGLLDSIPVSLGPLIVTVSWERQLAASLSVNAYDVMRTTQGLLASGVRLDLERSFRALTPVFVRVRTSPRYDGDFVLGVTSGRVLVLDGDSPDVEHVFVHEAVHLMQSDFVLYAWERPLEHGLRRSIPVLGRVPQWITPGAVFPVLVDWNRRFVGNDRFMVGVLESEAEWFERRSR